MGYKINLLKSLVVLYPTSKILNIVKISSEGLKYLGINLIRGIHWKLLNIAEIKEAWNNGEIHHVHGSEESISLRCSFSPDWSIDSMHCQSKSAQAFFFFFPRRKWQDW